MSTDVTSLLDRICDIVSENIDADCIAAAKRRHAATLAWCDADYIPIQFGREYKALDKEQFPEFNWSEQWHDPAKSLYGQLKGLVPSITSGSDVVPCVRSDTGVVNWHDGLWGENYRTGAHQTHSYRVRIQGGAARIRGSRRHQRPGNYAQRNRAHGTSLVGIEIPRFG